MQKGDYNPLTSQAMFQRSRRGVRKIAEEHVRPGLLPKELSLRFPEQAGRAFRSAPAHTQAISLVSSLAMLALVVSWLASAVRWSSSSLMSEQTHGTILYSLSPDDSRLGRFFHVCALALFVMAGVFSALNPRRPRLPRLSAFLLITMMMYCAFWGLTSYRPSEYPEFLTGVTSPFIYTMCIGVFAGLDLTLWRRLRPLALALAYGSAVVGFYYMFRFTIKGTFQGPTPTVTQLQTAFWFGLAALVLRKSSRWRDCWPALVPIALCFPMAVAAGSRSFTLLPILALVLGLMIPLQRHGRFMLGRFLAIIFLSAMVFGSGLWLLSWAAPERVAALQNRLTEDTRTGQYSQFFQQIPLTSLISGLGPKATYTYNDHPDFDYIDNQFLFILFKFGLPVLLGYWVVVVWPGLRLLTARGNRQYWLLGGLFFFWTLATMGLSIYHSIAVNPQNFLIILFAGRAFALAKTADQPARQNQQVRNQPVFQPRPGPNCR